MFNYPEVTVGGLVFFNEKILLFKSHKFHGKFVVPGGHVELGETLREALKREIKEETALNVKVGDFIIMQEAVFDPIFWKKKHFIFFDFVCFADSDNVIINDEAEEYVWVSPKDALNLDLEPYTRAVITAFLNKNLGTFKIN